MPCSLFGFEEAIGSRASWEQTRSQFVVHTGGLLGVLLQATPQSLCSCIEVQDGMLMCSANSTSYQVQVTAQVRWCSNCDPQVGRFERPTLEELRAEAQVLATVLFTSPPGTDSLTCPPHFPLAARASILVGND